MWYARFIEIETGNWKRQNKYTREMMLFIAFKVKYNRALVDKLNRYAPVVI